MTISLALDGTRLLQAGLLLLPQLGHQPMIDLKRGADFPKMHQATLLHDDALVADIPQHPGAVARQHHDLASSDAILHARSEEHTSELQSLMRTSYAVFCLKKKKTLANYKLHCTLPTRYKSRLQDQQQ